MTLRDQNGLAITSTDSKVVELYDQAVTELSFLRDPSEILGRVLKESPRFLMGHVFLAYVFLLSTDEADALVSRQSLELAVLAAEDSSSNEREREHIGALLVWLDGDMGKASAILDELLIKYPQDMLALLIGHQLDFLQGHALNLKNRVARVLPSWGRDHPLYGFVLGMYGFGLEEAREYKKAEDISKLAVEMNPKDVWGIHAVAHALEMQNRYEDGAKYMTERKSDWSENNFLIPHNALHLGLFELEVGAVDEILALSDSMIHNASTESNPIVLVDGSSLVWRFYLDSVDIGDHRAAALAKSWSEKSDQNFYSFNDVHAVMAFIAAGDFKSAEAVIESQKSYLNSGMPELTYFKMTNEVGLPLTEALYSFGKANYEDTIKHLMPIRNVIHHFGGSHAQRDAFSRTLIEAAYRANNKSLVQALLGERMEDRPQSPYNLTKKRQLGQMA